jgi:hypothetical protein
MASVYHIGKLPSSHRANGSSVSLRCGLPRPATLTSHTYLTLPFLLTITNPNSPQLNDNRFGAEQHFD